MNDFNLNAVLILINIKSSFADGTPTFHFNHIAITLGAVHKGRSHKIAKKFPPRPNPPPPCRGEHAINFENFAVFCTKKCERPQLKSPPFLLDRKMSVLDKHPSPLTAEVFYKQPLMQS